MPTINPNARFHCEWPEGYGDAAPMDVDHSFFSDDNGYWDEDVGEIAALRIGELSITHNFGSSRRVYVHRVDLDARHCR